MSTQPFAVRTLHLDLPALAGAFGRRLHEAGVPVTPERTARFANALALVNPISRARLYWTARGVFVSDRAQVKAFDAVFFSIFGEQAPDEPIDANDTPTEPTPRDDRPKADHETSSGGERATSSPPAASDDDEAGAEVDVPLASFNGLEIPDNWDDLAFDAAGCVVDTVVAAFPITLMPQNLAAFGATAPATSGTIAVGSGTGGGRSGGDAAIIAVSVQSEALGALVDEPNEGPSGGRPHRRWKIPGQHATFRRTRRWIIRRETSSVALSASRKPLTSTSSGHSILQRAMWSSSARTVSQMSSMMQK